ncbi:MFS transporter [Geodermatophilus sp. CPCC 206100]|uniref:MFS transporter n=1 Tax=Geodermatophilus sp. CPCC 206100 TaxID=3020054 RepID=UPI003B00D9AF
MPGLPRALAPLRHPRYRLLAASLALSLLTNSTFAVAVVWQVVALEGGPAELSLATGLQAGGMLASTLLGGALADRVPQRHILLAVALVQTAGLALLAVLSLTGSLTLWQLAGVALVGGLANGLYYPAYSALVPALLPEDQLLAANGLEGTMRPVLYQATGPALAGGLIAATSPGVALAVTGAAALGAAVCVAALPATAVRREGVRPHPVRGLFADMGEGFAYMVRTPWLLATLVFASLMILVMIGPFEVLAPFAIKDRAGGGPFEHALVLAAFGLGGAVGSMTVASLRLPRRYLTVMNLLWGLGCVPLVVFGTTTHLAVMIVAGLVTGGTMQAGMVIWGTLLQRRVPPALLGRVSSLDFFVSTAFMPLSMALAGPVSELIGLSATFLVAGLVPPVLALVVVLAARLPADELAHPLDRRPRQDAVASSAL